MLDALGIVSVEKDGFEADDLIATLATLAEAEGFDVLICTGDRDAYQLIDDHVTVLYPRKGVSDLVRTTPQVVRDKYGLEPAQYPDYAAIRGDPSDNLPNIPGVGRRPRLGGSPSTARSTNWSSTSTRSRARPVTCCALGWRRS